MAVPQPAADETDPLRFTSTVDRNLVHREDLGEVFLTDVRRTADNGFVAAAHLPRSHAYYGDHLHRPAVYDPLLLLEACRQAALAAAHQDYGVPADHKFIIGRMNLRLTDTSLLTIGGRPSMLAIHTTTSVQERAGQVSTLNSDMTLRISGAEIGRAGMDMRFKDSETYSRLRTRGRDDTPPLSTDALLPQPTGSPVPPHQVGRTDPRNVVLLGVTDTPRGAEATLRRPTDHPSMFDHPQDHLPGMVLAEAARQLVVHAVGEHYGISATKVFLSGIGAAFTRFGELDTPTRISATLGDSSADHGSGAGSPSPATDGPPAPAEDQRSGAAGPVRPAQVEFRQDGRLICTIACTVAASRFRRDPATDAA